MEELIERGSNLSYYMFQSIPKGNPYFIKFGNYIVNLEFQNNQKAQFQACQLEMEKLGGLYLPSVVANALGDFSLPIYFNLLLWFLSIYYMLSFPYKYGVYFYWRALVDDDMHTVNECLVMFKCHYNSLWLKEEVIKVQDSDTPPPPPPSVSVPGVLNKVILYVAPLLIVDVLFGKPYFMGQMWNY